MKIGAYAWKVVNGLVQIFLKEVIQMKVCRVSKTFKATPRPLTFLVNIANVVS